MPAGFLLKYLLRNKIEVYTENKNTKALKNIRHTRIFALIMVFIFSFFISYQLISLNYMIKNTGYDIYGTKYHSLAAIPLYDEQGMKYQYCTNEDKSEFYWVDEYGVKYDAMDLYLTKGGYVVFLDEDRIVGNTGLYDTLYDDGEHYYAVIHPCWNKDGDLIVDPDIIQFSDGSIVITKEEQENYRNSHNIKLQVP